MPRIRTAIILAAGFGTRFLPATKAVPKEMLPLYDRPVIQYIVEEALASGLDQIVIVTSGAKRAVEDHFDRNRHLEAALTGKPDVLEHVVRTGDVNIAFVRQKEMRGQAHAILGTRFLLGDEPFALYYPDDVIFGEKPAMRQLLDVHEQYGGNVLAVQKVPHEEIVHYGSIDPEPVADGVYRVSRIVEKPPLDEAPSDLGTVGRYVCTSEIWPLLEKTPATAGGEMFLTDTLAMAMKQGQPLYACEYEGVRFDTGRPTGLLKASLYVALHRPDTRDEFRDYLRGLNLD
ncbi:MAG TPA: UTP--glucose-1-phosphate uridylyltransferase [Dehalococcoidia bacterium]